MFYIMILNYCRVTLLCCREKYLISRIQTGKLLHSAQNGFPKILMDLPDARIMVFSSV